MHVRQWLASLETIGIKLGLLQITRLLEALGHPETSYPSIIVAGTNGKGSVTAMVERGLRAAGRRTGRYTSPHLLTIEERVAIDGVPLDAVTFDACADAVRRAADTLDAPPSFFEATTAVALLAFRRANVDIAVLEVGLGGRLDATNAVNAGLAVITAVDLDHQEHLGDTLGAIAREKAGVIAPGAVVVVGANPPEVLDVIEDQAASVGARLVRAEDGVRVEVAATRYGAELTLATPQQAYGPCGLRLPGRHQIGNAVTAVRALEAAGVNSPAAIRTALSDVQWPARLEWLRHGDTEVLLDGAHNPAGAQALASFIAEFVRHPVPLVLGVMRDKAADDIVAALAPIASCIVTTAAPTPRALPPEALAAVCRRVDPHMTTHVARDADAALALAGMLSPTVVVAGSLYLVGHVRGILQPA